MGCGKVLKLYHPEGYLPFQELEERKIIRKRANKCFLYGKKSEEPYENIIGLKI
jgi:hypothetical protein